jgi:hypothetical protein
MRAMVSAELDPGTYQADSAAHALLVLHDVCYAMLCYTQ